MVIDSSKIHQDAIDSIPQDVVKYMNFKRAGQNMDTYIMEFEMLRQEAEARMVVGSGPPDELGSVLPLQNAALTMNEKTSVLASLGNTLAFQQVSPRKRRLFGACSCASRQDVLVAPDMDTASEEEDLEAWMAYRKAKRAKKEGGFQGTCDKSFGEERTNNPTNRRTGERNRCYTCNSEYRYAPQCPQKENRYSGAPSPLRTGKKSPKKTYPSVAMEAPVNVGSPPSWPPLGRRASRNKPSPPRRNWAGNLRRLRQKVRRFWTLELGRIWFAKNGWRTIIYFWGNRTRGKQFHIPPPQDSNLEMGEFAK